MKLAETQGAVKLRWFRGITVDLFFPTRDYDNLVQARAELHPFARTDLPFVSATDLAILKATCDRGPDIAGEERDWTDLRLMLEAGTPDVKETLRWVERLEEGDSPSLAKLRALVSESERGRLAYAGGSSVIYDRIYSELVDTPGQRDLMAGELLVRARKLAALTQSELAALADVPQAMISVYEAGRRQPTLPTLRRLLAAAGVEPRIELVPIEDAERSVDRPQPYRPMTVAELARRMGGDPARPWLHVAEFLTEYGFEDSSTRATLLEEAPSPVGSQEWDAFLGALAEHLAFHDGVRAPGWVEAPNRFLDKFWFPFNTPSARADAIVRAPASFARRGVFVERRSLERV